MPTDVIIEPGSGQIYWNDSAGSPQSISIKGDAQNTISVVGYSGAFSPGSSAGGTFVIASFNDNSGSSAFIPGTTNYDLGSTTYRWSVYGFTGNFSSDVVISSSTQSTSVTSGALRVNGGVGISGRMYFNTAAMGTTGIASPPTFAFIGSTGDPIFLQVLEDNSLSFEGSQGQLFSITPNLSTGYIYSVNDITGIPLLRANANANVTANEFGGNFGIGVTNPGFKLHVVGSVGFTSVTASTTPTSGTLVVSGGVGVGGTLNVGGRLNLWNSTNTNFTSFVSTATGNTVYNLPATTPSTGSSVLQSDSVGNLSWVGFVANSAATATTAQNINTVFASTNSTHHILFSPVNGGSGVAVSSDSGFTINPSTNAVTATTFVGNLSATASTSGFVGVSDNTASTSTTTGALVVTGGVGIGQSVNIGGRVGIGTNLLTGALNIQAPTTGTAAINIRGNASQTADVISTFTSTGSTNFAVDANGRVTLTGLDGIWNNNVKYNIFDVSAGRINFNLTTWQNSSIYWTTAAATIGQATNQLRFSHAGTSTVSGIAVLSNGWDSGGVNRAFGILDPAGNERSFFRGYGNLVINPNNPNALHTAWNTMDLITLDISGTASTYSGNIIKGSVEGTERFSVGPFGNTRITVGSATTATGFIVRAVASQTGNLIETQSSAGATNFYVTPSGAVNVGSTAASISTSSGALTVAGGAGIGGTLFTSPSSASSISGVVLNNGIVTSGTWAGTIITTRYGGTGHSTYTKGDLLVGAGGTLARFPVGNDLTILSADSSSATGVTWKGLNAPTYGAFASTSTQAVLGANTESLVNFNYTYSANNVSTGSGTTNRVYINDTGLFDVQFSVQLSLAVGTQPKTIDMWFKVDGVNVPQSLTRQTVTGKDFESVLTVNLLQTFISGQYVQLAYSSPDANMQLGAFSNLTSPTRPDAPSVILTVEPVSYITPGSGLAITGLASLNLLTSNAQTMVTGTSGVDFGISSIGSVHTFNIPDASTTARGIITTGSQTLLGSKTFASGVAITATTASTSTTSGALTVSGGVGIAQTAYIGGNVNILGSTASTYMANGALTVAGGVGISGQLSYNRAAIGYTGIPTNPTMAFIGTTGSPITLTVLADNGLQFEGTSGKLFGINNNLSTGWIFNVGDISGIPLIRANADGTVAMGEFAGNIGIGMSNPAYKLHVIGSVGFTSITQSTSPTTGTLVVSGGVGVGQTLSVGGRLHLFNGSNFTAFQSAASGNHTYTLPANVPSTGTSVLQADTSGILSWVGFSANSASIATTAQNLNTVASTTSASHFLLFSPTNGASGVAVSSDAQLTYNPATDVLTASVFSGNVSATAVTSTNFFGTLTGNVTGNLTGTATTSQNVNTVAATTSATHYLTFSPVNGASGVALSSDANLTFNPSTNILTTDIFSGNVSATAVTSTNFFGTLTGNVTGNLTGTATTSQNINLAAGANNSNHSVVFSLNATGSGVALSSDAGLQYNPSTNVLTADVFSGNVSATAITATNFFGTFQGSSATAVTSQNINTTSATTAGVHYLLFSPVNATTSGVAVSSDSSLQYNPATNVLTVDVFSGNHTGTAFTATNFFGTLTGNVTGNLTGTATTSQNVNTVAATTSASHFITFSPVNGASGVALSSDANLTFNPSTNVLTTDIFSGNVSATAVTSTNFFGTLTGNVTGNLTGTATTAQNINLAAGANNSNHSVVFSLNATGTGIALSSDAGLQYNPSTNVLTADVFSGNHTGTAFTATNFFGTLTGNVTGNVTGTATTATNINTTSATTAGAHYLLFSPVNATTSGVAVSSDATLQFNPGTNVLTTDVFSGNLSATAATATNFFGTLVGNSSTATTASNLNVVSATTNSAHYITFAPAVSGSGLATSADADLSYNPSTNVMTAGVFSGNFTGTAATATNFFGTLVGNSSTATTAQNVNLAAGANAANHSIVFSLNATGSGVALSSDAELQYNPSTNALSVGTGSVTANSVRIGNSANTVDTSSGNLTLDSTGGQVNINDNVVIQGNLTVQGTTLTVDSTITTVVDPVIVLGSGIGGTHSTADNNQDRGIEFRYSNGGTAVTGYFGFQDTDFKFRYIPNATLSGTNVYSGNVGVIVANLEGNVSATAVTATNFFGTLVGNTATATTSQNINTTAATTAGAHFLLFSPVNATASGVAVSSDATLQFNPGTNVLTTDVFAGNLSATAATATNFFGTFNGSLVGTATTAQNVNVNATTINASHFITFSPASSGSGLATSTDTDLTYNPGSNVLTAGVFSGNVTGTAVTATNLFGTLTGNVTGNVTGTATTSQNVNTVSATTSANHFMLFSPVNGASGVALSSDAQLTYNPATDVLSASVFSGNHTGTAFTATNFFGTLTGNVTGNLTGTATTSQNINTVSATTSASHFITFSPVNGASGVALSSDAQLTYNPATDVLSSTTFSGNVSGTAVTATNFFGTLTGNVTGNLTGTATTAQNINVVSGNTGIFYPLFTNASTTASGIAVSINGTNLSYNFATNVLTAAVFSGNFTGTAATATNFFGTLVGNSSTATTSSNVNTVSATTSASHFMLFSPVNGASGVAVSSDAQLTYNPSTDVLTASVFSGNHTGTAFTATNFFGALTGNVTGTATTATNINTTTATTAGAHFILFSPVNATASGVAVSSDSTLQFNPGTNVLTTDIFSGNLSATAATATNFFGTLVGNSSTATTASNVNVNATTINATHFITFAPASSGSGLANSTDTDLTYNPGTNVLTAGVFSGNVTGTAITATNFFGTLVGTVGTATTSQNVNTVSATTNASHFITFSPVNGASGVAISSDAELTYNPSTNVLTAGVFSGNHTGTAFTATNFFGTLTGNVTGNLTGTATTSQNINTIAATTAGAHFLLFAPVNGASGVAVSSDAQLQFNPGTNVLTADIFAGNLSATAATATNFFGTLTGNVTGNVTGTATTAQNVNLAAGGNNSNHAVIFSLNATGTGVGLSSDAQLTYNPATDLLSATTFSGNVSGAAITATNFFGTLTGNVTGNVTGTATTSQNINTTAATTAGAHFILFSPVNATASGVAVSSDAQLQFNPATNVLTADVFSGNHTGTAFTATNFFGALTGNVTGTATTSQNVNTVSATTAATHFITFSPVNGASGVALSSDAQLTYNPATDVLSATTFSGNVTGTAITATNFFGTLVGSVGTATTSQNVNTVSATTSASHFLLFSPVNGASGVAVSSDAQLTYNPATDILSVTTFSGNVSGTAITATNFFGTLTGNVTGNLTGTATTAQNVNLAAGANNTNHSVVFSLNATGTGVGLSSDAGLQYNPSTNVLTADVFSGNHTGTAFTATNFFGALTGNVTGTATTSQNINTTSATTSASHFLLFSPVNGATGVAVSSDAQLTYNPATDVLTASVFSGNMSATAVTATNFFGTLVGNVTGTATTSQNLNTVSATTAGNHFLLFSPVNGASGVAVSSDATLQFNPATNVLTTDVFSGNVSGTAITATNFFGTLTGNVTGTATTAQNINLAAGANNANHSVVFSLNATGTGVGLSSDAGLQYNPSTNVLTADVFSGNHTGTAFTATNFFGTLTGNVTGNVTGTATTSQNINTVSATTSANHFITFSPVNGASGVALSSDAQLTYNPATDVLSATTFSGNVTGSAITATNFFGTLVGSVGSATTSQNINTTAATTAGAHYLLFSPVNATASGVAVSSDAQLQFNPATNVLTADVFSGNLSGTASTTGFKRVSDLTNTTSSTTGALVVSGGVGIGGSMFIDGTVKLNYTSGNAFNIADRVTVNTTNNFEGLNLNTNYSFAFNIQDKANNNRFTVDVSNNKTYLSGNSASHELRLYNANQSTYTGFAASNSGTVTYILPAGDGSSGQVLATNGSARLYWSTPSAGSGGGSSGVNPGAQYQIAFYSATGSSVDGSTTFTNNTATSTVSITHATSSTATNVGALVVTGGLGLGGNAFIGGTVTVTNSTASNSTATGAVVITGGLGVGGQINSASLVTSGNAVISGNLQFNGNGTFGNLATADTIAFNARSTTDFNPSVTNTSDLGLNTLVWRNLFANFITGSAVTATNFFGTLTGNVTGTATTAQNVNTVLATTSAVHYLTFSPVNGASGVALSSDTQLTYNPATDILSATTFSGNVTGTAITATNFFGTLVGSVGSATTATNINTTAATTAGAHYLLFSPVNATTSGVAVSSDAQLQFNPGTNVLTADVFSGNVSGTAVTATNFFGTLTGNVTGTATTAQNVNTVSANTNATHFLTFSPVNGGSGVALSTDTNLTFNSLSNVMTSGVFSGNLSATAATSGLFAVGNLTYAAANLLAAFQSSVNSYNQVIIQNSNNGASASSDLVVNNDISTDTGAFGTFGMNSSGFTGLGSTNIPNAVYVTAATAELVLGTTTNNRIRFVNENVDTFQITGTGSSVYTTTATLSKNSGAFVVAGGAAIGLSLSVGQGIQLYNSTNGNHTGFKAGATSANSVYTLPLAYPSTGSSILQSDTSGTMIWVNAPTGGSATPAGNNTELQYNNGGAFGGATGLTWQSVNNTLQINSNASHTTSAQVGLRLENGLASGGQATRWSPTFEMAGRSGIANVYFSRFATEVVPSGPATYASALRFRYSQDQGTASFGSNLFSIHSTLGIGIGGSTVSSNFMSYIRAHESQAADIFYKLPLAAPGTGASFLQCDTSGNMSWVNSPGGGSGSPAGSPKQIQFNNNGAFGGAGGFEYISVGGTAVTVSMFSTAGGGYTAGLWVNVLSASSTKVGIGLSNPQFELEINGELSATNKSFVIDHPTKPGMKLRYGSLEGPENGVYVRGELKGTNIITVPDHWIGLVHEDSYTVHLTSIGRYSQLYVEKIENYNVFIADNSMNPIHCYYSVWAERKDIPKLVTEY